MRIHRITLRDFRGVPRADIRFAADGITIVQGPNEVGKSSIADAIDMLLNDPDSSSRARVKAAQPVGRDVGPRVEMELETGPYRLVYAKQWVRGAATELSIEEPVPEQLTGRAAHDRVEAILAETLDTTLFAALRQQQGVALDQADLGGCASLGRALDEATGGGPGDGEPGGAVIDAIAQARLEWSTPTGAPNKARLALRDAAARARDHAGEQVAALAGLEAKVDDHRRLMRDIEANAEREPEMRTRLAALEEDLARVATRESLVRELDQAAELAEAAAGAAAGQTAARSALVAAVRAGEDRLAAVADEALRDSARLADALAARAVAAGVLAEAMEASRVADAGFAVAAADAQHLRDALDLELLGERRERVRGAEEEIARAGEILAGAGPDTALMDRIEHANVAAAMARGRLQAEGIRLGVVAQSDQEVRAGGLVHALGAGDEVVVQLAPGEALEVPGVVHITSHATGDVDREAAEAAARLLGDLLAQAGVPEGRGVDHARALFRDREDAGRRVTTARDARGQALRDLTVEEMDDKLARARDRVAAYAAARVQDAPVPASIDEAGVLRARAEDARDDARRTEDAARTGHEVADAAVREIEAAASERTGRLGAETARLEGDRAALAEARAQISDEALATDAERRAASARDARDRHRAEAEALAADDPASMRTLVVNQREAVDRLVRERNEMALLAERLCGEIMQLGDDGLADRAARAAELADAAEAESERAEARAAAADLLHEVMARHRDLARQAYVAPFRAEVERLARLVFGAGTSVDIDHATLRVVSRTRDGMTVSYEALSGGAREQLAIIGRLAAATLVAPSGGAPVIIDDALGYSDAVRLQGLGAALGAAGAACQVIVLTCVPERYSGIGAATVVRMDPAPRAAVPVGGGQGPA
jgi:hypothetical protein